MPFDRGGPRPGGEYAIAPAFSPMRVNNVLYDTYGRVPAE